MPPVPTHDQQIQASFQKILDLVARCNAAESSDNYEYLEEEIDELEAHARRAVNAKMDLKSLLAKLNGGMSLTQADLKTLELLIVGDAEYYLKYVSEIEEWKTQFRRVLDQIANLQTSGLDVDSLMHVRALCREAHEVLSDLVYYFDAKERTAKFKIATQGPIDPNGNRFLAEIIQEMLASDKM